MRRRSEHVLGDDRGGLREHRPEEAAERGGRSSREEMLRKRPVAAEIVVTDEELWVSDGASSMIKADGCAAKLKLVVGHGARATHMAYTSGTAKADVSAEQRNESDLTPTTLCNRVMKTYAKARKVMARGTSAMWLSRTCPRVAGPGDRVCVA